MSDHRFTTDDLMVELKYSNDIREIIENAVNKFQSSLSVSVTTVVTVIV